MQTFFTSDLHVGHKNIHQYRTPFSSAEEHHEFMINKILELTKRELLIIIGDFLFDCDKFDEYIKRLSEARCRIKLVMGNHDSKKLYNIPKFEMQLPLYSYKNMWISHAPLHPQELRNRLGNIHGHLHLEHVMKDSIDPKFGGIIQENIKIKDPRYFNVNIDVNDYKFVPVETIKSSLEENYERSKG